MRESKEKMNRILLIEDSKFYSAVIHEQLQNFDNIKVDSATTKKEALQFINDDGNSYRLALVDLNLPDASQGETVDYTLANNIPTIVFSGVFDSKLKASLFDKGILDYVVKDSPVAINYLIDIISIFLSKNKQKILLASSNKKKRQQQIQILSNLQMSVWVAETIAEAKKITDRQDDIALAIIGEELADGTGLELVTEIRHTHSFSKLAILAMLDDYTKDAAQYLRYGANDFLRAPFSPEEFQCRLFSIIKMQDQLHSLEFAATRDFLTGALNRRAFFEASLPIHSFAQREKTPMALAILDIDFFKKINDTFGHNVGDLALKKLASVLSKTIRESDIFSRFGGEEFCLLMPNLPEEQAPEFFTRILDAVRDIHITSELGPVTFTASLGICFKSNLPIEDMIKNADDALYNAKETGRDKFVVHE